MIIMHEMLIKKQFHHYLIWRQFATQLLRENVGLKEFIG